MYDCCQPVDEERANFTRLAGEDGEIDAFELQDILNQEFKKRLIYSSIYHAHTVTHSLSDL